MTSRRATSITAAIANAPQNPFEIATCELAEPQDGEVLVRVHACGSCHTDMAVKLQHNRHLGYGYGIHACIGRHLAKARGVADEEAVPGLAMPGLYRASTS